MVSLCTITPVQDSGHRWLEQVNPICCLLSHCCLLGEGLTPVWLTLSMAWNRLWHGMGFSSPYTPLTLSPPPTVQHWQCPLRGVLVEGQCLGGVALEKVPVRMQTCTHTVGLLHGALLSVLLRVCISPCWQHGGPASDRTGLSICRIYPGFTRVSRWGSQWAVSEQTPWTGLSRWLAAVYSRYCVRSDLGTVCKQSVINPQTLANPYYFNIILSCPGFTPMCVFDVFKMFLNRFILASPCNNVMLSQDDLYGSLSYCLIASIFSLE